MIGGAFSEIRGGSFKSGFLAAGFSSAVAPYAPANEWAGAAFNAAAGGVGSVLGGGKFADGAVTATFAYLVENLAGRSATETADAPFSDDPADGIEGVEITKGRFRKLKVVDGVLTGEITYRCWQNQECGYEVVRLKRYLDSVEEFDIVLRRARFFESAELTIRLRSSLSPLNSFAGRYEPETGVLNLWNGSSSDTLVHEFGHALGLRHRLNSTQSVMSYSSARATGFSPEEISAIVKAYGN